VRLSNTLTPHSVFSALLVLSALWMLGLASASVVRADEAPVMLTNEDLARLHPKRKTDASARRAGSDERTVAAKKKTSSDALDARPNSWQEEYYRLKTLALKQAMRRGDPIELADEGGATPGPAAPSSEESVQPAMSTGPACMYASDGALFHAPTGMKCAVSRALRSAARPVSERRGTESCIYGKRGQVLHRPAGRSCPSRVQAVIPN
jgi:hypothetical protein